MNSIANGTKSIAKVTNSIANRTKSIVCLAEPQNKSSRYHQQTVANNLVTSERAYLRSRF